MQQKSCAGKRSCCFFSDTVRLRLPGEGNEIIIPKSKVKESFWKIRSMYSYTSNDMISAVSSRDKASAEKLVMMTAYVKWTEKNGKRNSILYHDDWRLKDGKFNFLLSYSKLPTMEFLKKNSNRSF
jgi:hypothetical protein